jgi:Flp pilus assembly protein TadG
MLPTFASRHRNKRCGAAVVEFACVAPIFFLLLFGIIEFGRAMMVQQVLINATREGARQAAMPGVTMEEVEDVVAEYLTSARVAANEADITITPDPAAALNNEQITVGVSVPYSEVSWIPSSYISRSLRASTTMRSERLD